LALMKLNPKLTQRLIRSSFSKFFNTSSVPCFLTEEGTRYCCCAFSSLPSFVRFDLPPVRPNGLLGLVLVP
jgi:hypothetical protein